MTTRPENDRHPENKHPYRYYWLTAGLATLLAAIIGVSIKQCSSPSPPSNGASPGSSTISSGSNTISSTPNPPSNNVLLTSAEMEQAAGGSWSLLAADAQSLRFSCFPLPTSSSTSRAEKLTEALGAQFYEVVDSFPSAASASQAYTSFVSSTNNCSWQNTNNLGTTSQFNDVPDSNAPSLDSASGLWDIQGAPVGSLNIQPSHDGAICAVRSGNLDAFAFILVDGSNSPSMTLLENNIEPALAKSL